MKLQIIRLLKDELARTGEPLPAWIDVLLYTINKFIDQVGVAIQGQLSIDENLFSKKMTVNLTHNTEYKVSAALAGKTGLKILGVNYLNVRNVKNSAGVLYGDSVVDRNVLTGFGINDKPNSQVGLVAQFSKGVGTTGDVTFIIHYQGAK